MMDKIWRDAFFTAWAEWRRTDGKEFNARLNALQALRVLRDMANSDGVSGETWTRMTQFIERAVRELADYKPAKTGDAPAPESAARTPTYH